MKREQNFENFYVYEGNKVAYLAAKKIVEFPGELFNPLYIYSGTGLGKTHLLRAIFIELGKKTPTKFFSAKEFEKFISENRLLDCGAIVDDLHMISKQYHDHLLGITDAALTADLQICFSGNAAPRELKGFDSKILSRLEGGLVCDIASPKEMALIEMIKQKSSEAGILLPDEVALELAQISTGSIRTIEGMINRLVAYSSLGSLSLDIDSARMILKEFYPKGIYSPVSSLLEELKKNASEVLADVSERLDVREEYKEKIYIWEMKGFDTSLLRPLLDGDIEILKKRYDEFIKKVERLIELQKEYGSLDTSNNPDEAMKIESMLFSPEHVEHIEELTALIKREEKPIEVKKPFSDYIIGDCNRSAYKIYKEQIFENLGSKFNPLVIFGGRGVGKTRFLQEIKADLETNGKQVVMLDLKDENALARFDDVGQYDVLLIDNYHAIFGFETESRNKVFKELHEGIDQGKAIIVSSERFAESVELSADERSLLESGMETELSSLSRDVVKVYIESKLEKEEAEEVINLGIPEFASFYSIDDFIEAKHAEVAPVEVGLPQEPKQAPETEEQEVVALGLPGEEEKTAVTPVKEEEVISLGLLDKEPTQETLISEDIEPPAVKASAPAEMETDEKQDMVSLGLPGEEVVEPVISAGKKDVEKAEEKKPEKEVIGTGKASMLKEVHEERFIIREITGELVEDNY